MCVVYNNDNRNKKPPFTKRRTFYTLYTLCWIVVSTYVSVVCVCLCVVIYKIHCGCWDLPVVYLYIKRVTVLVLHIIG